MTDSEKPTPEIVTEVPRDNDPAKVTSSQHSRKSASPAGALSGARSKCSSTLEYMQESFDTYQQKVAQLCLDIGKGEPTQVTRMKGGSFNRIIGLKSSCPEPHEYILRIPRNGIEFHDPVDIKDQVATLHYMSQFIPVPSIAAFDTTQNNALGSAYVLQERIPGNKMEDIFYDLPLADKLQITSKVAEVILNMESIKQGVPGRFAANDDLPHLQHKQISFEKTVKILGYRASKQAESKQFPALEKQQFTLLMWEILEHHKNAYKEEDD